MWRRILGEPLLHFLVLGVALFIAFTFVGDRTASSDRIVVTRGRVEHLASIFSRSWRRSPTPDELNDLVGDYVREEIFYREAKAMQLDKDDPVIRRRLRQKLEFLSEDTAQQREPTDDDLRSLLKSEPERFRTGRRYTFRHVFLDPTLHQGHLAEVQANLRDQVSALGNQAGVEELGDRFLLGNAFADMPSGDLVKLFGDAFARQLDGANAGAWQGPLQSGYGVHFVLLARRDEGHLPDLDEARPALRREWSETQRVKANAEAFDRMRGHYHVVIEDSPPPTGRN